MPTAIIFKKNTDLFDIIIHELMPHSPIQCSYEEITIAAQKLLENLGSNEFVSGDSFQDIYNMYSAKENFFMISHIPSFIPKEKVKTTLSLSKNAYDLIVLRSDQEQMGISPYLTSLVKKDHKNQTELTPINRELLFKQNEILAHLESNRKDYYSLANECLTLNYDFIFPIFSQKNIKSVITLKIFNKFLDDLVDNVTLLKEEIHDKKYYSQYLVVNIIALHAAMHSSLLRKDGRSILQFAPTEKECNELKKINKSSIIFNGFNEQTEQFEAEFSRFLFTKLYWKERIYDEAKKDGERLVRTNLSDKNLYTCKRSQMPKYKRMLKTWEKIGKKSRLTAAEITTIVESGKTSFP